MAVWRGAIQWFLQDWVPAVRPPDSSSQVSPSGQRKVDDKARPVKVDWSRNQDLVKASVRDFGLTGGRRETTLRKSFGEREVPVALAGGCIRLWVRPVGARRVFHAGNFADGGSFRRGAGEPKEVARANAGVGLGLGEDRKRARGVGGQHEVRSWRWCRRQRILRTTRPAFQPVDDHSRALEDGLGCGRSAADRERDAAAGREQAGEIAEEFREQLAAAPLRTQETGSGNPRRGASRGCGRGYVLSQWEPSRSMQKRA